MEESVHETKPFSSFGTLGKTCRKADDSNVTWDDGIKYFLSRYLATSRMWPIGYVMDSPYSPLHLERQNSNLN